VCPACYARRGDSLEDIFVSACEKCGWVRTIGAVCGAPCDTSRTCQYCLDNGSPEQNPENEAAYTRKNFQRRVRNYFPARVEADPGTDLLPLTAEKFQNWIRAIDYEKRDRGIIQAAFHENAASVAGLLKLFEMDKYKLQEIAIALGQINEPEGNNFLLDHVNNLREEPYNAELALVGLCESPGETSLAAVLWLIEQGHFSIRPAFGLELLLKLEFLQPGFLFRPKVIRDVQASLESIGDWQIPQHLAYFRDALNCIEI